MNAQARRTFEVVDSEAHSGRLRTRAERKRDFDWKDLKQSPHVAEPFAGFGAVCLAIVCTVFVALVLGAMVNGAWHSLAATLHKAF